MNRSPSSDWLPWLSLRWMTGPRSDLSGSGGALLRPRPLRTGRATFIAPGSSRPRRDLGVRSCWAAGGVSPSACGVDQAGSLIVREALSGLGDRLAVVLEPLLPLLGAGWLLVRGQECPSTGCAPAVLRLELTHHAALERGFWSCLAASPGPVFGQGRIVRRRRSLAPSGAGRSWSRRT